MTTPRCPRCNDIFEQLSPDQVHCLPCGIEVAQLIAADTERRARRVWIAKDFTGVRGYVL